MSRRKDYEQRKAWELRAAGWSVRQIAGELAVAVSSVSVWVRDVALPAPVLAVEPEPEPAEPTEFRICGRCRELVPITGFNRNGDDYQYWCRECFRSYFKVRGQLHRDQVHRATVRRRAAARAFVAKVLAGHPCRDCGEPDVLLLEFDHVGMKTKNISAMVLDGVGFPALKREIAQCEVVCVNCHRRRTYARLNSWRVDPSVLDTHPRVLDGRARNMLYVRDLLMRSRCVDCGLDDFAVLEFDHVRGRKVANITALCRRGHSLKRLRAEIGKCEVRCANCHRRRTRGGHLQLKLAA